MARFFVLEGLDGAGTTTQSARLASWLSAAGRPVVRTFEPSDGPVGRLIRTSLRAEPDAPARATLPWMFAADRADHLHRKVLPALERGTDVVCDRYVPSSLAYQSLERPLDEVWELNRHFRVPDLLLFLHVPVALALARIGARGAAREIYEEQSRLERVASAYDDVMQRLSAQGWPVVRVDGSLPVEAVEAAVRAAVGA